MSSSSTTRAKTANLDRIITTGMSANIVRAVLKQGWTVEQIAEALAVPHEFVVGVRAKRHVFTTRDIKRLAKRTRQPFQVLLLNSISSQPGLAPLVEATRRSIEISVASPTSSRAKPGASKGRSKVRAA